MRVVHGSMLLPFHSSALVFFYDKVGYILLYDLLNIKSYYKMKFLLNPDRIWIHTLGPNLYTEEEILSNLYLTCLKNSLTNK